MLTPVQSGQSMIATGLMQSIIDGVEERQREEAEKRSGRQQSAPEKTALQADEATRQSNTKINEFFFGDRARNSENLAKLISRFADALGVSQRPDETSRAFAQRLTDALAMIEEVSKTNSLGKATKVTLIGLGTTLENVQAAMEGGSTDDAVADRVARYAISNGIVQNEDESDAAFEERLNAALTEQRQKLPSTRADLEKQTGLRDLGISAKTLIEAIKNPYGPEAQQVKDALADKAADEKALTPEMRKVLARLEDTADPKTIEELKAERTRRDPTRVEDAETRQEREEDIRALEAGEKLEDVRELQEAVGKANDAATGKPKTDKDDEPQDTTELALSAIQVLASGAEANERAEAAEPSEETDTEANPPAPPQTTAESLKTLQEQQADETKKREDAKDDIFVLRIDDNGIYDLITQQLMAA
ncbi:MAG: hypothetical protein QHC90_21000 [Shinella sp.]|nr:hypothetical protein [Shinella sp.]